MLVDYDTEGMLKLYASQIILICIDMVEQGRLDLGREGKQLDMVSNYFASFNFKNWDRFDTEHDVTEAGEPVFKVTNNWGGMMTIAYRVCACIFAVLLITTFHYQNIAETRSSLPAVAASQKAFSNVKMHVSTMGDNTRSNCVTAAGQ